MSLEVKILKIKQMRYFKKALTLSITLALSVTIVSANSTNAKAEAFANQLFENCIEHLDSRLIDDIAEVIERVSIVKSNEANLPLVSTNGIKSKCLNNTNLFDNFNPETFNYFLFYLDFWAKETTKYRIDGTEYVLIIQAQTTN